MKAEWEALERGGAIGADVLGGSTSEVELGSGTPGKGFRYTYDTPGGTENVGGTDARREPETDETDHLFSNIGR